MAQRPSGSSSARAAVWVTLGALALVHACVRAEDARQPAPVPLKLSVAFGPAYALGKAGDLWAKRIAERSDGRLQVKVYVGAALAQRDATQEFTALEDGAADLAVGSTLYWSAQVSELGVVGLPWIAPGRKRLAALLSGSVADTLFSAMARANVVALAMAPLDHHALATKDKAVALPADLAGLRVRVATPGPVAKFYVALGARPQMLSFPAAESAFMRGALDAQDAAPATFAASHLYALGVKRVLLWDAIAEAAVFAVSRYAWDTWSAADRALVRDAAREVAGELAGIADAEEAAALRDLARGGVTVERLTPAGREKFVTAIRPFYEQSAAAIGPALVRAAEAAAAAASE
jgi:TRAP-type C4-dicarboxylate transport system substrate-binding protein